MYLFMRYINPYDEGFWAGCSYPDHLSPLEENAQQLAKLWSQRWFAMSLFRAYEDYLQGFLDGYPHGDKYRPGPVPANHPH